MDGNNHHTACSRFLKVLFVWIFFSFGWSLDTTVRCSGNKAAGNPKGRHKEGPRLAKGAFLICRCKGVLEKHVLTCLFLFL